jgi:hypothetical protein
LILLRLSAVRATTEREFDTALALVAFKPADPLQIMRPRHHASAKSDRFARWLIRHNQVVVHA